MMISALSYRKSPAANEPVRSSESSHTTWAALCLLALLAGCAATPSQPPCPAGRLNQPDCPPAEAIVDADVERHYEARRWRTPDELEIDPVKLGMNAEIPVKDVEGRIIGASYEDSVASLASKIWLIDNARHSVDAAYYIFKPDLVGLAFLGALCEAVERGVDVRVMVDAVGSQSFNNGPLKALENCAIEGGFLVNGEGAVTTRKARVQTIVFSALTNVRSSVNRRSHDKLLVVDGAWPERAWVMTGGRNISLSYYGLKEDGSRDPGAYKDLEILLRPRGDMDPEDSVGQISEYYFSLLFSTPGNKRLSTGFAYRGQIEKAREALARLRVMPDFAASYANMDKYLFDELQPARARLAHELGNLISENVVHEYDRNLAQNPNSIIHIMRELGDSTPDNRTIRVVSPYLFVARYQREDESTIYHGGDEVAQWLAEHPDNRLEVVTNSILTSDNFFAQSIIDMDTAPQLLLDDDTKNAWRDKLEVSELNPQLVESEAWQTMVNNPRVKIYQTGRSDSDLLGGDVAYGKLHAKFVLTDEVGFVGTTNLDYRSRLFNNEVGFFFIGDELREELREEFEALKAQSYLWGSPEWLEMRAAVRELGDMRASWAKKQRSTFTRLRQTNLHWQF